MWTKSLKALVVALVACLAPGCVTSVSDKVDFPPPLPPVAEMHGDLSFSPSERSAIEKSFNIWKMQTGGQAVIKITWDYEVKKYVPGSKWNVIQRYSEDSPQVIGADCEFSEQAGLPKGMCLPVLLGWADPAGGIHNAEHAPYSLNLIPDRYEDEDRFVSVTVHELGHIFGLPHTNVFQAAMYPSNEKKTCLSQADLTLFCSVNVCDGRKMFPCE